MGRALGNEANGAVGLVLALLLAATPLAAVGDDPGAAADRYIEREMRAQGIPGLSLSVLRRGQPVYVRGYGVATLEHPVSVGPDTRFQIGSIGKQFTAVATMLLAREGRLSLDAPLARSLPGIPATWAGVTPRLMLNHQSGIPQLETPEHNLLDRHHDYSDEEYIRLATSVPLDFAPGTGVSYSDTAYVLLGFVINRVTGGFYGDMLAARVFAPLGMTRTRIISDADIIPGRASGYEKGDDGALRNQSYVSPALNRTADGSLYSTVVDLARWDEALYGERILTRSELARMWRIDPHRDGTRPLLHYGYGWEINSVRGHRVIEYDGNWQGFQAAMARYENPDLTVIVLTNLSLCRAQRLAHTVAGFFEPVIARYETAASDPAPALTREFAALLSEVERGGTPPAARLTKHWRAQLTLAWAHALARDIRSTGAIGNISFGEERSLGRGRERERVYLAATAQMNYFFAVRYTADGLIADIDFSREY
jgi:CubicO group peptidase (beta-lactamase class C family)